MELQTKSKIWPDLKLGLLVTATLAASCAENKTSLSISNDSGEPEKRVELMTPTPHFTERKSLSQECSISRALAKAEPSNVAEYSGGKSAGGMMSRKNTLLSLKNGVTTMVEETSFANIPAKLNREYRLEGGLVEINGKSLDGAWSYENRFKESLSDIIDRLPAGGKATFDGSRAVDMKGRTRTYDVHVKVEHLGCLVAESNAAELTSLIRVTYIYKSDEFRDQPTDVYSRIYEISPYSWFPIADQQELDVFKKK